MSEEAQDAAEPTSVPSSPPMPPLEDVLLAALFAGDRPLARDELVALFDLGEGREPPSEAELDAAIAAAGERLAGLPLAIRKLASGYRIEVGPQYAQWINRLWVERPARYSRALLETLALIAYRQPITRPEIEAVRGVAVGTQIVRTMQDRGWIRVVGHRDAPGRPALYGTTRLFLDYFGLASLEELPTLAEIRDLAEFEPELPWEMPDSDDSAAPTADDAAAQIEDVHAGPMEVDEEDGQSVVQGPWPNDDRDA